jgi:transposase
MKKLSTVPRKKPATAKFVSVIGVDIGDRSCQYCKLNLVGEVIEEGRFAATAEGVDRTFGPLRKTRVILEAGCHSPWMSRQLSRLNHEVIVANPRRVKLIHQSSSKNDRLDAQALARLGRIDPQLLHPIQHRSAEAQADLSVIRARAALVEARTALINTARGFVKSMGARMPSCGSERINEEMLESLPKELHASLGPLLAQTRQLTETIAQYDRQIAKLAKEKYPETQRLDQVVGVGTLTALTYVLTIELPDRFAKSRQVGCALGLRPKQYESGESSPQLGITKEGDRYLRTLLVQSAQYILGPFGPDTDLRRWGLALASSGGKRGKKRALVAVARKLAVLLHALWKSGKKYEPLRQQTLVAAA